MNENQFTGHFSGLLNALEPLRRIQQMVNPLGLTPAWAEVYRQQLQPLEDLTRQITAALPPAVIDHQYSALVAAISSQVSQNVLAAGMVSWPQPVVSAFGNLSHWFQDMAGWQTTIMHRLRETTAPFAAELPVLDAYGQQLLQEIEQLPDDSQQLQELRVITAAIVEPTRSDSTLETMQVALGQLVNLEQQHGRLLEQLVAQGNDAGKTYREYLTLIMTALALLVSCIGLPQCSRQASEPAKAVVAAPGPDVALDGSILIVEQEIIIADEMQRIVQSIGYTAVQCVRSGQEALDVLRTSRVALVMTSVRLDGEMTGIELGRQVRQEFAAIPVLLVSGYPPQLLEAHVKAGAAHDFLCKPFIGPGLQAAIERVISRAE
ncbi:response regulator [Hymenobacter endophyticus]|uniref:Response regulator n=1 Tax=Hymenobacter endophyticus TaxID=3076335 RepID=A0ABU3TL41_9BACT|nr:response regulator [Hymenobacter endophyticus]MDU0372096.1 response regulator [Hymenobacter endophyticus]